MCIAPSYELQLREDERSGPIRVGLAQRQDPKPVRPARHTRPGQRRPKHVPTQALQALSVAGCDDDTGMQVVEGPGMTSDGDLARKMGVAYASVYKARKRRKIREFKG